MVASAVALIEVAPPLLLLDLLFALLSLGSTALGALRARLGDDHLLLAARLDANEAGDGRALLLLLDADDDAKCCHYPDGR